MFILFVGKAVRRVFKHTLAVVLRKKRNRAHKEHLLPRNFSSADSAQSTASDAYRNVRYASEMRQAISS